MADVAGRQHVLQTGLMSGLSTTEGYHSNEPNKVDSSHDGSQYVLPQDFVPKPTDRFDIKSKSGPIPTSYLSVGAWSWGDTATWQWKEDELPALKAAWKKLYDAGINYIDTAQAYGSGQSEVITGDLIRDLPRDKLVIQTKWYVVPDNLENLIKPSTAPEAFLRGSLDRMKLDYVDVYMVHGPIHRGSIKDIASGMAACVEKGLTKAVAVGNYHQDQMLEMQAELAKYDIPLALNQCEYSIARRLPETDGLLKACNDNGIAFQSYSSLAQGRLTGKYGPGNEPPVTHRFSSYKMEEYAPILDAMRKIAEKHGSSVAGVGLNYNLGKNVKPVVGIRKEEHAQGLLDAYGWRLTKEEYKQLDDLGFEGKHTMLWQQG